MIAFFAIAIAAVAVLVATWRSRPFFDVHEDKRMRAALERYARALRLRLVTRDPGSYRIEGIVGRSFATIVPSLDPRSLTGSRFEMRVVPAPQIPRDLEIRRRARVLDLREMIQIRSAVWSGDAEFDRAAHLAGDPFDIAALLDYETREMLIATLNTTRAEIADGAVSCVIDAADIGGPVSPERLAGALAQVAFVAAALSQNLIGDELAKRIAKNARTDPDAGVRHACLLLLVEHHARTAISREACRAGLSDRDEGVRLLAAMNYGDDGVPHVRQIAGNGALPSELREIALLYLGRTAPGDSAEMFGRVLLENDLRLQLAALGGLTHVPAPLLPVPRLMDALKSSIVTVARDAARLLGKARDLRAERPLLALLERSEAEIKLAAIWSLGEIGTIRAVEQLVPFARSGVFSDPRIRRAAEDAVADIQARLKDPDGGRLSLATADRKGALSIGRQSGDLSFPGKSSKDES